jgi:nicotinamidase-related amidase
MANEERAWDAVIRVPEPDIDYTSSALIVIDLQNSFARRDQGLFARLANDGLADESEYAIARIEQLVVPNVSQLVAAFRARSAPVVFARSASIRGDGSDQTARHRAQGLVWPEWSEEAQVLAELDVRPGDVVLTKSGSGCFTSTNLDHVLRNMGVGAVVLTGMWTNSCVETTARHAGDLDYDVVLVEDACVAMSPENHAWALRYLGDNFALVRSTDEVVETMAEYSASTSVGS